MNAIITDRQGNRLYVPPTIPRLDISQREFQRRQFVTAAQHQVQTHRAAMSFLDRCFIKESRP